MSYPFDQLSPVLDQLIQAKRDNMAAWQACNDVGYTPVDRLQLIQTIHLNFGRQTGQTHYMVEHAIGAVFVKRVVHLFKQHHSDLWCQAAQD